MKIAELREWLVREQADDSWWAHAGESLFEAPITIDEIANWRVQNPGKELQVINVAYANDESAQWLTIPAASMVSPRKPKVRAHNPTHARPGAKRLPGARGAATPRVKGMAPRGPRGPRYGRSNAPFAVDPMLNVRQPKSKSNSSLVLALAAMFIIAFSAFGIMSSGPSKAEIANNPKEAYRQAKMFVTQQFPTARQIVYPAFHSSDVFKKQLDNNTYEIISYGRALYENSGSVTHNFSAIVTANAQTGNWELRYFKSGQKELGSNSPWIASNPSTAVAEWQ